MEVRQWDAIRNSIADHEHLSISWTLPLNHGYWECFKNKLTKDVIEKIEKKLNWGTFYIAYLYFLKYKNVLLCIVTWQCLLTFCCCLVFLNVVLRLTQMPCFITVIYKREVKWSESHSVLSDSLQSHGQSLEFSRPEYWSGYLFPSPEYLPNPGIKPRSPTLQACVCYFHNSAKNIVHCVSLCSEHLEWTRKERIGEHDSLTDFWNLALL